MSIVLRNATLIDGTGADPRPRTDIRIDDDRIAEVGEVGSNGDAEPLDLDGLTLLPGLIDAHVHLATSVDINQVMAGTVSLTDQVAAIFRNCSITLDSGFTTVRDTGGIDLGLIRATQTGTVRGPRIIACGPVICQHGGHGHFQSPFSNAGAFLEIDLPGLYAATKPSDGPEEIRHTAREAFRRGASFLKLCVTGGVVSTTDALDDTQFTVDEIRTAVIEARARHTYVTVHSHNNDGIKNALDAGVRCIEHGTNLNEENAARMATDGVSLVPTMAIAHLLAESADAIGLAPEVAGRVAGVEAGMAAAISVGRAAGVRVGAGSDLIGGVYDRRGLELVLRAKVTDPMEAILASTAVNADIIGLGDQLGTVEVRKTADLIAVDGDPIGEPGLFDDRDRIVLVIKDGVVVKDTRR